MTGIRGLELVCIGRRHSFELRYEAGRYLDPAGREVTDLLDMTCVVCGASYYTLEGEAGIEFCPACGRFERRRFGSLPELLQWASGQHWGFLKHSGNRVFAVQGRESWELRFGPDEEALRRRGERGDLHPVA